MTNYFFVSVLRWGDLALRDLFALLLNVLISSFTSNVSVRSLSNNAMPSRKRSKIATGVSAIRGLCLFIFRGPGVYIYFQGAGDVHLF